MNNKMYDSSILKNNISSINAKVKWQHGYTGKNVIIAIIDSGVQLSHPRFKKAVIDGYNFSTDDQQQPNMYTDYNGHGTHTASIVLDVAPNASLLILKQLNKYGVGSINNLIAAIEHATAWRGKKGESVQVISMSLATNKYHSELHRVIKKAIQANIAVVVSVGNGGNDKQLESHIHYPAYFSEVISVGALTEKIEIAPFSNKNDEVDIYAPGTNIIAMHLNQLNATMSGTSTATPHVAGALALLIEEYFDQCGSPVSKQILYHALLLNTSIMKANKETIRILKLNNYPLSC